jgi:hypothetical protein
LFKLPSGLTWINKMHELHVRPKGLLDGGHKLPFVLQTAMPALGSRYVQHDVSRAAITPKVHKLWLHPAEGLRKRDNVLVVCRVVVWEVQFICVNAANPSWGTSDGGTRGTRRQSRWRQWPRAGDRASDLTGRL